MIRTLILACLLAAPAQASPLKISTWNLDWLTARSRADAHLPRDVHPRTPADIAALAAYARKLAADVVAFQEVDGPDAAALVFDPARYTILVTAQPVTQRVGLAVRTGIPVVRNADYTALDVEPDARYPLRDGLDATLTLPGNHPLRVLVVHLKTGCQTDELAHSTRPACALFAQQIPPLAAWAEARLREGAAFLILGDFNRVLDQPEPLGAALAGLTRVTSGLASPCWEGGSFIDHIFVGGAARGWVVPDSLRVQVFQAAETEKARLSDHCPVSVRIEAR